MNTLFAFLIALIVCACVFFLAKAYVSHKIKYDGQMVVTENSDGVYLYSLELDGDPEEFRTKDVISFRVIHSPGDVA